MDKSQNQTTATATIKSLGSAANPSSDIPQDTYINASRLFQDAIVPIPICGEYEDFELDDKCEITTLKRAAFDIVQIEPDFEEFHNEADYVDQALCYHDPQQATREIKPQHSIVHYQRKQQTKEKRQKFNTQESKNENFNKLKQVTMIKIDKVNNITTENKQLTQTFVPLHDLKDKPTLITITDAAASCMADKSTPTIIPTNNVEFNNTFVPLECAIKGEKKKIEIQSDLKTRDVGGCYLVKNIEKFKAIETNTRIDSEKDTELQITVRNHEESVLKQTEEHTTVEANAISSARDGIVETPQVQQTIDIVASPQDANNQPFPQTNTVETLLSEKPTNDVNGQVLSNINDAVLCQEETHQETLIDSNFAKMLDNVEDIDPSNFVTGSLEKDLNNSPIQLNADEVGPILDEVEQENEEELRKNDLSKEIIECQENNQGSISSDEPIEVEIFQEERQENGNVVMHDLTESITEEVVACHKEKKPKTKDVGDNVVQETPIPVETHPDPKINNTLNTTSNDNKFRCTNCDYSTDRVNNLICHMKSSCKGLVKRQTVQPNERQLFITR